MDFDKNSLSPTYRILMGVPGESRALEVASKNGLPDEIVAGARKYLAEERADISELIRGLTEKHRALEDIEADGRKRLRSAMEEQRKADLDKLRLRQREIELRERGVGELRRLLSESRRTLENLVKEIREGALSPEKTKEVKEFLARFADEVVSEEGRLEEMVSPNASTPAYGAGRGREGWAPAAGALVHLEPSLRKGVVLRAARKGFWVVETDSLRLTVAESALRPADEGPYAKPQVQVELAPRGEGGRTAASFELDLRGYRLAEAIDAVEKQIDAASLQGLGLFQLLHGTGEGVLGKGIHEYLRAHPAVADYHFARPEEGGYGKTVVRLK
jgi:DNA mismatch repair protein MutS2